jgi:putative ABC transport system permease protein
VSSAPLSASLRVGVAALRLNPLRSVLSALGVIIGVGAMISVLSLSDGVEREIRGQLERDGRMQSVVISPRTEDMVDGQPIPRAVYARFTAADARSLAREVGTAGTVFLGVSGPGLVTPDGGMATAPRAALVSGTLANGVERRGLTVEAGRFFTDAEVDAAAHVVVLSRPLAAALAGAGTAPGTLVGRTIRLQGAPWQVVGVLADAPRERGAGQRPLAAYVPVSAAAAAMVPEPRPRAPSFLLKAARVEDTPVVQARAEAWLARRGPDWRELASVASYEAEGRRRATRS